MVARMVAATCGTSHAVLAAARAECHGLAHPGSLYSLLLPPARSSITLIATKWLDQVSCMIQNISASTLQYGLAVDATQVRVSEDFEF